jgi:predicted site-specific integrase-resolvase
MTARQFAARMGVNYRTALNWLKLGLVPGAVEISVPALTSGRSWEIPESALAMTPPRKGRGNKIAGRV